MKKLTLNKTWEQCLKMWRWIVRQPCPRCVNELKEKWLEKNGFDFDELENDCFFCDYATRYGGCEISCPGNIIDKNFCCGDYDYHFLRKPAAFLRKITELNKKRLARRKK